MREKMCELKILMWLMTVLALMLLGCEENKDVEISADISIDAAQNLLFVKMNNTEQPFYVTCTDSIKLFHVKGDQRKRLGRGVVASEHQWKGYFADDKLIAPIPGEGCDILSCESFAGFERDFSLRRYELIGERTLTEADKETYLGFPGKMYADDAPDTLPEYVSQPVHGNVEVVFTYLDSCDDHTANPVWLRHVEPVTVP